MTSGDCVARKASAADPLRCAVLISGSGSGMEKLILHQQLNSLCCHQTVLVISDKSSAAGLGKADTLGINNLAIELPDIADTIQRRSNHESLISQAIEESGAELVILSGYMRILSPSFVNRWAPNLVNIHPSLLPHFPGADAHGGGDVFPPPRCASGTWLPPFRTTYTDRDASHLWPVTQACLPCLAVARTSQCCHCHHISV